MALRINFNYESSSTHTVLKHNERMMNKSLLRLSSGLRIINASDDAAGIFIADQLSVVAAGLKQGNQNIQTALSALRIAENSAGQIFVKLREIYIRAESAANDINDPNARTSLQREINNFVDAIAKIANDTEYNGITLLNGKFSGKKIHYGARVNQTVDISISSLKTTDLGAYMAVGSGSTSGLTTFDSTGGDLANFLGKLNSNYVLASGEYVKIAETTVYEGSSTDELIDAAKLASQINSNTNMQKLGIEATASNISRANTAYDPNSIIDVTAGDNGDSVQVHLKFYIGDGSKSFTVELGTVTYNSSGNTINVASLEELVNRINTAAADAGAPVTAIADGGYLKLVTDNGETIALEAKATVTDVGGGSNDTSFSIDLSQILEFGSDVTTRSLSATAASGDFYGGAAKVGNIQIAGADSFKFEYDGVSSSSAGDKGFAFTIASGDNTDIEHLELIDVSTNSGAEKALLIVKKALQKVDTVRAQIGATMNNLQSIYDAQKVAYDNTKEAENVIRNVDYAEEMSNFTTYQIRMQSGIAMLAQANQLPQMVLQLLR